jgi:8-oxo-dGTP pyrophosphatase MutT (NUDIX family)
MSETEFEKFKEDFRQRLNSRIFRRLDNPGYRASAVMIIFTPGNEEPSILITQRTQNVGTHKGQMSLPGGGTDPEDKSPLETALRETHEEAGIPPEKIELLGRFDDYISIFGFHIAVFAGAVNHNTEYIFNPDEIDAHIEAPFSLFLERKYDKVTIYNHESRDFKIYHYYYNNYEIWGLTARILTDLAEELYGRPEK